MIQINLISLTKKERNVKIATIDTETNKLYCVEFTEKSFLKMIQNQVLSSPSEDMKDCTKGDSLTKGKSPSSAL